MSRQNGAATAQAEASKISRNQLKRLKKRKNKAEQEHEHEHEHPSANSSSEQASSSLSSVSHDRTPAKARDELLDFQTLAEIPSELASVFARFQVDPSALDAAGGSSKPSKGEMIYSDDELESDDEDEDGEAKPISKKKQRKMARLTVAELKSLVKKPEVVEWFDVTADDPRLLVAMKSYRNTVPVPPHWSAKREYLQGKRGIEKPPFQLPIYIADTGIAAMRDTVGMKDDTKSLKAQQRAKVQPKTGKIDIDYQKLHDAFFKYQTKPPMSGFGEVYYEGKEFETQSKSAKPGELSAELKEALSIPPMAPPPWLIAMQRYGPPPSYPSLKIPGMNAPIPDGAQWGFHAGGWGKPPVDEYNRPLYGDVFGMSSGQDVNSAVDRNLWGFIESEEEDSEDDSDDSDEDLDVDEDMTTGTETPSGLATPSGMATAVSTIAGGLETPDVLELRKNREQAPTYGGAPQELYRVLDQRSTSVRGLMGSEMAYDMAGISGAPVLGAEDKKRKQGTAINLNPEELEGLTQDQLKARLEQASQSEAKQPLSFGTANEDFSDMITKESLRRQTKASEKSNSHTGSETHYKF